MVSSKDNLWGDDGRISPLTLEAMQQKGALAHELEPITLPKEESQVARVRYNFLEQQRAGTFWLDLDFSLDCIGRNEGCQLTCPGERGRTRSS